MRASEFISEGYSGPRGRKNSPIGQIKTLTPNNIKGKYTDDQLIALGFKKDSNDNFSIPLIKWNKLRSKHEIDVDEGWKQNAAAAAMALGMVGAPSAVHKSTMPANYQAPKTTIVPARPLNSTEKTLTSVAKQSGIKDPHAVAQLLAQSAHETGNFSSMEEKGSKNYLLKKYWNNPNKRKTLGNKRPDDAIKYKGRGFIQLTGRYNYDRYGKLLGIDLLNNPELASNPKIASEIAVKYFQDRVEPKVDNFRNTIQVTKAINPSDSDAATAQRTKNYVMYANLLGIPT